MRKDGGKMLVRSIDLGFVGGRSMGEETSRVCDTLKKDRMAMYWSVNHIFIPTISQRVQLVLIGGFKEIRATEWPSYVKLIHVLL